MNEEQEFNDGFDAELKKLLQVIENFNFGSDELDGEDENSSEIEKNLSELDNYMNEELIRLELPFKKIHPDAVIPTYAYDLDSGFDFLSIEEIVILPFRRALAPTGLAFEVPDGTELQVRSKSGLAINQGLMVLNSPGTVDCGFLGEIKVILMNMNDYPLTISKGQKIAQGVLCPVFNGKKITLKEKENFDATKRASNGFGSTGI